MMQLPPGFDFAALFNDYLGACMIFAGAFGAIAAYYVYCKVVNSVGGDHE